MTNNYSAYLKFAAEVGYNITTKGILILPLTTKNPILNQSKFKKTAQNSLPIWTEKRIMPLISSLLMSFKGTNMEQILLYLTLLASKMHHLLQQLILLFTLNYKLNYK
jgi:hypothetical protein